MNNVTILRKEKFKDYWVNGCFGGIITGIFFSLLSLIENSLLNSFYNGLIWCLTTIFLFCVVGFFSQEYYLRKKKIKKLHSKRYSFLDKINFKLNPDLYFEGVYKSFYFRIYNISETMKIDKKNRKLEYEIIEAFYDFDPKLNDNDFEDKLSGDYYIGNVTFENHLASLIPKDWINPNFEENMDALIEIFHWSKLYPLSIEKWENTIGKQLEKKQLENEKLRTRQILKIGKLDIKYIKNE